MMRGVVLALLTLLAGNLTSSRALAVDPNGGIFYSPPVGYNGYIYPGYYYTAPTFYYPPVHYYLSYNPYFYPNYYYIPTYYQSYAYPTYYYQYAY